MILSYTHLILPI